MPKWQVLGYSLPTPGDCSPGKPRGLRRKTTPAPHCSPPGSRASRAGTGGPEAAGETGPEARPALSDCPLVFLERASPALAAAAEGRPTALCGDPGVLLRRSRQGGGEGALCSGEGKD